MNALRHTLDSLPTTLDETYNRILNKVNKRNRPLVQHILQCVCFFVRPVSVEEVRHICRIGNHRKPPFDSEDALFDQKDVIDLCSGLLCLLPVHYWPAGDVYSRSYHQETVQFAHFSVKEYLLSTRAMSWRLDEELSHLSRHCILSRVYGLRRYHIPWRFRKSVSQEPFPRRILC
jgi:hypothetical protein